MSCSARKKPYFFPNVHGSQNFTMEQSVPGLSPSRAQSSATTTISTAIPSARASSAARPKLNLSPAQQKRKLEEKHVVDVVSPLITQRHDRTMRWLGHGRAQQG